MQIRRSPLPHQGFTILELMVVIVIMSLTTSLLMTGLTATWQNFAKLDNRSLLFNQAQLPKAWFMRSIDGAVLGHPDERKFVGSPNSFSLTTFETPDGLSQAPQEISWQITSFQGGHALNYINEKKHSVRVAEFSEPATFEYLVNNNWQSDFSDLPGELPKAIRIVVLQTNWVLATIGRPAKADVPPELKLFGEYEF